MMGTLENWNAPKFLMLSITGIVAMTVLMAGVARRTDVGAVRVAAPSSVETIDLLFADRPDGSIVAVTVDGEPRGNAVKPGQDGFVRVALRSLSRDRRIEGFGSEVPFRLGRQADGRLWLQDLATGRVLLLDAYGNGNAMTFAQFLQAEKVRR